MIRLNPGMSLEVVLGGAVSTNQLPVHVGFYDVLPEVREGTQDYFGSVQRTNTNSGTTVTVCNAPQQGVSRIVDWITIHNADSASATVTLKTDDGSTEFVVTVKTLTAGQTFWYERGAAPEVF